MIDKIIMHTDLDEKITVSPDKIDRFISISKINPAIPIQTLRIKNLPKISVLKVLFSAIFRKLLNKKPALTEALLISLIFPKIKFKKITKLEINILDNKVYFDLKKIHLLNLMGDLRGVVMNNQYNVKASSVKNKIVIDAGAHNGEFAILAALLGAKKVYAFEPVLETRKILAKNIKINKLDEKIKIAPYALGDKNEIGEISFDFIGDGGAKIQKEGGKYSEKIEIIKLDEFLKQKKIDKVGFIKMDIEGFEENALIGAADTIKKQKPILSFSAYHKPTDKKILPEVVRSIRPDYSINLHELDEADFYCY